MACQDKGLQAKTAIQGHKPADAGKEGEVFAPGGRLWELLRRLQGRAKTCKQGRCGKQHRRAAQVQALLPGKVVAQAVLATSQKRLPGQGGRIERRIFVLCNG